MVLLGAAGTLTPVILAAMARDRTLISMINVIREEVMQSVTAAAAVTHDRINRVRDEYVRRDDLEAHLKRIEKTFDDIRSEIQRGQAATERKLDSIQDMLRGKV